MYIRSPLQKDKGTLLGTPNREPQEYSRNIMEYEDPGRYIPIKYLPLKEEFQSFPESRALKRVVRGAQTHNAFAEDLRALDPSHACGVFEQFFCNKQNSSVYPR